ncbi:MAG TPA: hypothetical protein VGI45_22570 [Terracidiphilus sp.]|jgi:hypothetical protein
MGVWGTGIFQDDSACDIRDTYRDYLGQGMTGPKATERILADFKSLLADPHETSVVWLALAAVQWKVGRLEPNILAQALQVIDSGSDLNRWNVDAKDCAKRKAVLEKLRVQITSPQSAEKKVARYKLCESHWSEGDLIGYRLLDGRLIIFCVIGHHTDKGGTYPVCELLDWIGEEIPPKDSLRMLEVKRSRPDHKHAITQMMLVGLSQKWSKRLVEIEVRLKPTQKRAGSSVVHFKYLEQFLKNSFLIG